MLVLSSLPKTLLFICLLHLGGRILEQWLFENHSSLYLLPSSLTQPSRPCPSYCSQRIIQEREHGKELSPHLSIQTQKVCVKISVFKIYLFKRLAWKMVIYEIFTYASEWPYGEDTRVLPGLYLWTTKTAYLFMYVGSRLKWGQDSD